MTDHMPAPGDPVPKSFIAQPDRFWRIIFEHNLQATHCRGSVEYYGRRFAPSGTRWWRVAACAAHTEGLTGLRRLAPVHAG